MMSVNARQVTPFSHASAHALMRGAFQGQQKAAFLFSAVWKGKGKASFQALRLFLSCLLFFPALSASNMGQLPSRKLLGGGGACL